MLTNLRSHAAAFAVLAAAATAALADAPTYQKPPKAILDILDASTPPTVSVSPARDRLLLVQTEPSPRIADLAEPMLRLAGLRINPANNGPHTPPRVVGLTLQSLDKGDAVPVAVPSGRLGFPSWSPDGQHFAFAVTEPKAVRLYVGSAASGVTRRVPDVVLNAAHGAPFHWMLGGKGLLCHTVVTGRGAPPEAPRVPPGPRVQEGSGKASPARTLQDLLQNPHDEDLFDYYATSQLVHVDLVTNKTTPLGQPGVLGGVAPSPCGRFVLVTRTHRPYSYLLAAGSFPKDVEVWDREGKVVLKVASLPLADGVPIEGVPTGPRDVHWVPTESSTLVWAEALDGGDPRKKVPFRDEIKTHDVGGKPTTIARTEHRFTGLLFGPKGSPALLSDYDRDHRRRRTFLVDLLEPGAAPRLVWDRSTQDRYNDSGTPLMRVLPTGHAILWENDGHLFLAGAGATPAGERPFLDRLDLKTLKTERLWRCGEKSYENVVALLSDDGSRFLTRCETPDDPPNYFVHAGAGEAKALTAFTDPAPQLRGVKKQLVTYKRADGVPLSMTLYLPADHKEGQRLPAFLWAYPLEFTDARVAGQVAGSPYHFTRPAGTSHLFLLTQGYAVLDGATMPVVGDPEKANDTFVEQIVASAKAAIDKADAMGVIDPKRVGVGGHSYGAFMTANLLANCDLFRAGIARSGAYNRTLTPFGFQSERRTIWEAPETYLKMSPFLNAHKIKAPLLLIHGEADNNPGTFPVQSERMYQAVKGNGGTVRFVSLPYESHGYSARESVEHTLYEMVAWLDRYVKKAE